MWRVANVLDDDDQGVLANIYVADQECREAKKVKNPCH